MNRVEDGWLKLRQFSKNKFPTKLDHLSKVSSCNPTFALQVETLPFPTCQCRQRRCGGRAHRNEQILKDKRQKHFDRQRGGSLFHCSREAGYPDIFQAKNS